MSQRILIVNVNWLGDVLFSTPAIRALRKRFRESHLACLAPPRCYPVLKNNPYLDEVIVADDRHSLIFLFKFFSLVKTLKQKHFDTAIFFHRSKTKVFLARLAGIGRRVGVSAPWRDWLLTDVCPPPAAPLHRTDFFLKIVEFLGVPADGRTPDFFPDQAAAATAAKLLESFGVTQEQPYVVVHPGANWELKRWPIEHFVEWINLFLTKFEGKVVIVGTQKEKVLSDKILNHFDSQRVVSLCGKTSLDVLAVVLKNAALLLSNDSGPIHLAASQHTKILGLFGPTSPRLTGPLSEKEAVILQKDVGCEVPCYFRSCDHRVCMEWLRPQEVCDAALKILK
jgi:lipopolysaccharide heptosyltransferase II